VGAKKIFNNPTYAAGAAAWTLATSDTAAQTLLTTVQTKITDVSASLAKLPYSGSKNILITSGSNTY